MNFSIFQFDELDLRDALNWGPKSEIFRMFVEEMLFICDAIVRNGRWWRFRWSVWRLLRVPLASKADETPEPTLDLRRN